MFEKILVPLDGSSLAERAIPHAEKFARIFGGKIILLRVLDVNTSQRTPLIDPVSWQIDKTEAGVYLQDIAARLRLRLATSQSSVEENERVETVLLEGRPAENIVSFAHAENISLVVLSTHGRGGLSRWNLSSVAQKVISMIYLPVLLVRAYCPPESEETDIFYRRVLLPTDGSRRAECVLSVAIALQKGESPRASAAQPLESGADAPQAKLVFASVLRTPEIPIPQPYGDEIDQLYQKLIAVSRKAVKQYLDTLKLRICVDCETYVIESDHVTNAIHDLVEKQNIDLVILSAHGYSGQFTYPYGSIAQNYIEHGAKPVLIIQDIPQSMIHATAAQIAAEKAGKR
jgi:nucleotide-binding universal stress UspA family protein